jgi:hypothetical protein
MLLGLEDMFIGIDLRDFSFHNLWANIIHLAEGKERI